MINYFYHNLNKIQFFSWLYSIHFLIIQVLSFLVKYLEVPDLLVLQKMSLSLVHESPNGLWAFQLLALGDSNTL